MKGSPPAIVTACSLQNLFAVEDEFEDEDFLSAVVDTENKFSSSLSVNPGCLKPVCSEPKAANQASTSEQLTSCSTLPSGALSLLAQGLRLPTPSVPSAGGDSPKTSTFLRLSPSPSLAGGARDLGRVTPEGVTTEPHGPFSLVNQHPVAGTTVTSKQDEFSMLSCMELRQGDSDVKSLFLRQKEDPVQVKRFRMSELGESCCQGSVVTRLAEPLLSDRVTHHGTPQLIMRPGASSSLTFPSGLRTPTQSTPWQAGPRGSHLHVPQPLQVAKCYAQNNSQNSSLTPQPFQSPRSWENGKPRVLGPAVSNPNASVFPVASSGQRPLESQARVSPVESLVFSPSTPCSSLAASGILQTPIVTNHLVQLVTATSRTPGMPAHMPTRAKARRFPGPAGILPHQHSGKNLEEIMISTPQTPAHGALAKFRTEEVPSSQPSEEDFEHGPWLTMKAELGLDDQDPACFLHTYSIVMVLRKAALKQLPRNKVPTMAVMIKSLSRNTVDASVVFKDPTGEMQGTVHRLLLEERQNELRTGSVLLLKQIGVFSPSLRNHYLNVTPNNLVQIYSPDCGDGRVPRSSQPLAKISRPIQCHSQPSAPESPSSALHCDEKPGEEHRIARMEAAPREELPEEDDLDGLLGELPEDFFSDDSGW
ncbi:homologous recombination OB-fold protein [Trichosurus vulpecula]|uniref:homologous recombination OB-fold protein n=1 Tax=Trichosurus vulpecula TaxID=9337 RepID=UPI00186B5236|nr:homologous recombination OB-fold protein [Trichosurus vulpecula]